MGRVKAPLPLEQQEAKAFYEWCGLQQYRGIKLAQAIVMIPNGAHLAGTPAQRARQMMKLKAMGFRVGAHDYFLPIPRPPYYGMWLELKRRDQAHASAAQEEFHHLVRHLGYFSILARGWEDAAKQVSLYLGFDAEIAAA